MSNNIMLDNKISDNKNTNAVLRIAGVVRESIVDGPGIRFTVFCQGCPHDCPECHNPQTHDFDGGYDCDTDRIFDEIMKNPLLKGVTFSGGEPFCQAEAFAALAARIKKDSDLDIVSYSGYTYEELISMNDEAVSKLLLLTDILVDGPYLDRERDLTLRFRGSKNQRMIDMNETRKQGRLAVIE